MSFLDFIWHYVLPFGGLGSFLLTAARSSTVEVERLKGWGIYALKCGFRIGMTVFYWYLVYDYATQKDAPSRFETTFLVFNSLLGIWFSSELIRFLLLPAQEARLREVNKLRQELDENRRRAMRAEIISEVIRAQCSVIDPVMTSVETAQRDSTQPAGDPSAAS